MYKLIVVVSTYIVGGTRPPSRVSVHPSRLSVPPARFRCPPIEIWALDDQRKKTNKFRSNIASNSAGKVIQTEKHFNCRRRHFFGLYLIFFLVFTEKTLQFLAKTFSFLVCMQFRQRHYVIFTKVLSHAKRVWSRVQKRPPMQNFTI